MLSVLIPTYNHDCRQLLDTLLEQLPASISTKEGEEYEILVGDDCSKAEYDNLLRAYCEQKQHDNLPIRYLCSPINRGSAAMRNLLCQEAKGDILLYIDSDTRITDPHFIGRYLQQQAKDKVICGTILHPDKAPSAVQTLRWKYEKRMEQKLTLAHRNAHPYGHFRTSHFMIPRQLMLHIPFDESIRRSGYEDVLFGRHLEEEQIVIKHCNITALNADIEPNDIFLNKTQHQLHTLWQQREVLAPYSTLLNTRAHVKRLHLDGLVNLLFTLTRPIIQHNLLGKHPCITFFQFYKLGYYMQLERKSSTQQV